MKWHVVSIDDLAEVNELIQISLDHPHLTLHQARNGSDGLTLIRDLTPDLVIRDLLLPGMNGWDVYDTIRADDGLGSTPIIILSVLPISSARHANFEQNEFDCYITKPFNVQPLRNQVMQMLKAPTLWS